MLRTTAAVIAGKATRVAARLRGGGGSALPGLVAERIDPAFLANTLRGVTEGIVVVSGTNGKTTTTKMLVAILRAHGKTVFTNPTGSNFTRGVISSMLGQVPLGGRLKADLAVLELDEAHALHFAAAVAPTDALLLNVARDQLDRFAEIDHTARLLGSPAGKVTRGVILNIDDSYISRIEPTLEEDITVGWFGLDEGAKHRLTELQEADLREGHPRRPPQTGPQDAFLRPVDERSFEVLLGRDADSGIVGPLELRQRGLAAMINATAAIAMAASLLGGDFSHATAEAALRAMPPPFGRGEVIDVDGQPLELVLVKNPAGFTVALGTYVAGADPGSEPVATMITINDLDADGRDVSWLYDVDFSSLRAHGVALTSGIRAWDMALRLEYDDVEVRAVEPDLGVALDRFLAENADRPKRIFCSYTTMMAIRRVLADRFGPAEFGEDEK